jgi:hypothetical protein
MNLTKCSILFGLTALFFLIHKFNLNHLETHSEKFYQKKENYKIVKDFFYNILPHDDKFEYASDILLVLTFAYMTIMNYNLIYQFMGFALTIMLLREIIIHITVLPKHEACYIEHKKFSMIRGGCYDNIFSGHFGIGFLMTLLLYANGFINNLVMILINILNAIFIILSRSHYSIDIIVSIFVVIIIYQNNLNIFGYLDKYC